MIAGRELGGKGREWFQRSLLHAWHQAKDQSICRKSGSSAGHGGDDDMLMMMMLVVVDDDGGDDDRIGGNDVDDDGDPYCMLGIRPKINPSVENQVCGLIVVMMMMAVVVVMVVVMMVTLTAFLA